MVGGRYELALAVSVGGRQVDHCIDQRVGDTRYM